MPQRSAKFRRREKHELFAKFASFSILPVAVQRWKSLERKRNPWSVASINNPLIYSPTFPNSLFLLFQSRVWGGKGGRNWIHCEIQEGELLFRGDGGDKFKRFFATTADTLHGILVLAKELEGGCMGYCSKSPIFWTLGQATIFFNCSTCY